MNVNLMLLLASMLAMNSCTKVVNYDLVETPVKIVIEGRMIKDSMALVRVTQTAPYLENKPTPVVANAFIIVSDNNGNKDTLDYYGNGYYKGSTLVANTSDTYTLIVNFDGKQYTASTSIPETVSFLITGYNYADGVTTFQKKGYYPVIKATLPPESFFLFNYFKNDSVYRPEPSEIDVTDSKFIGTQISGLEAPYPYQANDVAKICIYRITNDGFKFYNDLGSQLTNDGGFFSTPPANTSTNFSNGAIGIFMGASLYVQTVTITP